MLPAFVALCIQRQRHTRVVHSIVLTLWSSWLPGGGGPESHHWDLSKEHLGFLSSDPGTINQNQFSRFITLICYTCHAHTHTRMHSHIHTLPHTCTHAQSHTHLHTHRHLQKPTSTIFLFLFISKRGFVFYSFNYRAGYIVCT